MVVETLPPEEVDAIVDSTVDMFMKAYGAPKARLKIGALSRSALPSRRRVDIDRPRRPRFAPIV